MNPGYLLPRLVRHFMPPKLARALLRRKIIIRPGLETVDPASAVNRYLSVLQESGFDLEGKRALVFGYGGNFAVGCGLLQAGASHVVLCDRFVPPDEERNRLLMPAYEQFLTWVNGYVRPRTEYITLLEGDIREAAAGNQIEPVDLIVSSSVFEHLDDVTGITQALAGLTSPGGFGVHFIDLRDHFFRYPFEMLRYSSEMWRSWLNPDTNLNRLRLWDYRRVFQSCFQQVEIQIVEKDPEAFSRIRDSIRPEFISGNIEEDCATIIRVTARYPVSR